MANEADDFKNWYQLNNQLVKTGSLKRSDFYKEMYYRVSQFKAVEDKSNMLLATNRMIKNSEDLEAGNITLEEFNTKKRDAAAIWSKPGAQSSQDRAPLPINLFGDQINCTSTTMGSTTNSKCW
jgi:hypothetical protein